MPKKYELIDTKNNEVAIDKGCEYLIGYYDKEIKKLQDEKARLYEQLKEEMEKKGIKKIENDRVAITYVDESTYEAFDKTSFKKENKDIYNKYASIKSKDSYILVKVKYDNESNKES